ncbi:MAG: hypothetical protein ACKVQW_08195 [Pyrinomonadaceae bacterium]
MLKILFVELNIKNHFFTLLTVPFIAIGFATCNMVAESKKRSVDSQMNSPQTLEVNGSSTPQIVEKRTVSFLGVKFQYNSSLADDVSGKVIDEYIPDDQTGRPDGFEPKHLTFQFKGPNARKYTQPEISVYPISEYKRTVRNSGEYAKRVENKFQFLRTVLTDKPSVIKGEYPFITYVDATQVIHAHKSYFSFKNGSGIAYLTQFNHGGPYLINNEQLLYVFQGMTTDGKYLISATFPISAPFLPNESDVTTYKGYTLPNGFYDLPNHADNERRYSEYLLSVQSELEATPDGVFVPNLTILEEVFTSMEIGPDVFKNK